MPWREIILEYHGHLYLNQYELRLHLSITFQINDDPNDIQDRSRAM